MPKRVTTIFLYLHVFPATQHSQSWSRIYFLLSWSCTVLCDFAIKRVRQKRHVSLSPSLTFTWQLTGVISLSLSLCLYSSLSLSFSLTHMHAPLDKFTSYLWVFQLRPQTSGAEKELILIPNPNSWREESMIIINGTLLLSFAVICFIVK